LQKTKSCDSLFEVEKTNDGKDEVVFHAGNVHRFAGIAITCHLIRKRSLRFKNRRFASIDWKIMPDGVVQSRIES